MAGRGQPFNANQYNTDIRNAIAQAMMLQSGQGGNTETGQDVFGGRGGNMFGSPYDQTFAGRLGVGMTNQVPADGNSFPFPSDRFPSQNDFNISDPTMQPQRTDRLDRVITGDDREPLDPNNTRDFTDPIFDRPVVDQTQRTTFDNTDDIPLPRSDPRYRNEVPDPTQLTSPDPTFIDRTERQAPIDPTYRTDTLPTTTPILPTLPTTVTDRSMIDTFQFPDRTNTTGFNLIGGADDFHGSPRGLDVPTRTSRLLGTGPYINQVSGRGRY